MNLVYKWTMNDLMNLVNYLKNFNCQKIKYNYLQINARKNISIILNIVNLE